MTCEGRTEIVTNVTAAASRLAEVRDIRPGSDLHVEAMKGLLETLREPGALSALLETQSLLDK